LRKFLPSPKVGTEEGIPGMEDGTESSKQVGGEDIKNDCRGGGKQRPPLRGSKRKIKTPMKKAKKQGEKIDSGRNSGPKMQKRDRA